MAERGGEANANASAATRRGARLPGSTWPPRAAKLGRRRLKNSSPFVTGLTLCWALLGLFRPSRPRIYCTRRPRLFLLRNGGDEEATAR